MVLSLQVDILDRVFYALAKSATPEEILAIYSTPAESQRFDELTEKKIDGTLSSDEKYEVHQFLLAERYMRLAKAYAFAKLNNIDFE